MNEQERLQELFDYRILDTSPEKELDEIAEIASAVCDTPISLISFVDEDRQWFKAKKGLGIKQTPRQDAFCQHALVNPKEVLVVDDPLNDSRFKDNPLVLGKPNIRFYAGAPLETPNGNVLGTLCILDDKPRSISETQKKALMLLAKKGMEHLETRKLLLEQHDEIELSAARLKKLTDQAPGAIFQLEMRPDGKLSFPFISKGMTNIHPHLNLTELKVDAEIAFSVIHPDDLELLKKSIQESFINLTIWDTEYRVISDEGSVTWHWVKANPEKKEDGSVVWYGTFQDITGSKEYIKTLEQILFDISHVMRKPVAKMLGLTAAINKDNFDVKMLKTFSGHLRTVSEEMDDYIKELNEVYYNLKLKATDQHYSSKKQL